MRLVRAIALFVLTVPTTLVVLVLLADVIAPGRGFLPRQRRTLAIDFVRADDYDGGDAWRVAAVEVLSDAFDSPIHSTSSPLARSCRTEGRGTF